MSNYIVRGVMKRQSKVKRHAFQYFQRGHRMLKIVVYATKQPFKIICKMGGNFFQSCEFDDMSPPSMPIRWGITSRTLTEQLSMSMANSFENERLHFSKIYFILS